MLWSELFNVYAVNNIFGFILRRLSDGWNDAQLDEFRIEIQRRDQEILAMAAKMKALEEQHQDYQRHIAVLKESLCAKEEHYSMLQTDVRDQSNSHLILILQLVKNLR